jgi:hypothetical protein
MSIRKLNEEEAAKLVARIDKYLDVRLGGRAHDLKVEKIKVDRIDAVGRDHPGSDLGPFYFIIKTYVRWDEKMFYASFHFRYEHPNPGGSNGYWLPFVLEGDLDGPRMRERNIA